MRFFAVLAFAVAASATLIRRQNFPLCANSCLLTADTGNCGTDDKCLCNSRAFVDSVTQCIEQACQGNDLTTAEGAAQQLCLQAGVTLTSTPSPTGASSTSGSASGSATSDTATSQSTGTPTGTTGSPAGITGSPSSSPSSASTSASNTNGGASHGANSLAALLAVGAAALVF